MHRLGLILAAGTMLGMVVSGAPAKAEDAATRAEAALGRIAAMSQAQQRAWLGQLEARWTRAARLTLEPAEARREQARAAALLGQLGTDRKSGTDRGSGTDRRLVLARETLAELLGQLDHREKTAVSRLVRQYRLLVQDSFRDQPARFVERREAWFRVWSRWEAAGSLADEQDRLIDWLEAAIRRSRPGSIGPLPREPSFGLAPSAAPVAKVQPPVAMPLQPAPVPVRLPEPAVSAPRPREAWCPVPQVAGTAVHRAGLPADEIPPAVSPPPVLLPAAKITPPGILNVESRPAEPPRAPPRNDLLVMLPEKAEEPGTRAGKDRDSPSPVPLAKEAAPPSAPGPAASGEQVQVDLQGLAARIAGVNLALRTLEGELEEKHEWSAEQLHGVLSRLDILMLRQKDLGLFRDLVPPREQAKAGAIESPRQALAALAARIAEARSRLRGAEADGGDAACRTALRRLDELSDRLAVLASEK
jgi:hypothetical protein